GNVSSCVATFTVVDKTPPVIVCPASTTASADANCQAAVPDLLANLSASDNCTPANQLVKAQIPAAGSLVGVGTHPINVTVTDGSGNVSSCTATFTVVDKTAPLLVCPASTTASA